MSSRPLRTLLLGMVVLCTGAYFSLGLAVRANADWLRELLSADRFQSLDRAYARAAAGLFSGDSDGDGASDGLEWFRETDPHDPHSHPPIDIDWNTGAPARDVLWLPGWDKSMGRRTPSHEVCFVVNQRRRLIGRAGFSFENVPFSPGFRVRLKLSPGWLSAPPGEPLAGHEWILPVASDGTFTLDLQPVKRAAEDQTLESGASYLSVRVASTGDPLEELQLFPISTLPPLTASVEGWFPDFPVDFAWMPLLGLTWPAPPVSSEGVLIESRAFGSEAGWVPVRCLRPDVKGCNLANITKIWTPPGPARLEFRVTPFLSFGPSVTKRAGR